MRTQFTHEAHMSSFTRATRYIRRLLRRMLRRQTLLSRYVGHPGTRHLSAAYMLLEDVGSDRSQMLSNTWDEHREDGSRRRNLFRGIARVMLSLARVPQRRIGSFHFNDDGTITLANRPLMSSIAILENDGTPRALQKGRTYAATDSFVSDVLGFYDKRLATYPNALIDEEHCRGEMASKVLLRALAHHYIRDERREGPFVLQLDDLHISNIFVDDAWNITSIIDLEWAASRPAEMLAVPY